MDQVASACCTKRWKLAANTSGHDGALAVTVLTSMGEEDLAKLGVRGTVAEQVLRIAAMALANGLPRDRGIGARGYGTSHATGR